MKLEARFWQALSIVAILISGLVPAWVTFNTALHPPLAPRPPQKRLVTGVAIANDLLSQLNGLGNDLQVSMSVSNQPVKNIVLLPEWLQNTGEFPIETKDYQGNLGFSIAKPWRVVAIYPLGEESFNPKWSKISDQSYETQPVLFNPNDKLSVNIYVTNPETSSPLPYSLYSIGFHWIAHIEGVQSIEPAQPPVVVPPQQSPSWGLIITFDLVGLVIFVTMAGIFLSSYLYLADEVGIRARFNRLGYISFVVLAALLSVSAAEAVTTFAWTSAYGNRGSLMELNAPPIILNICIICILLYSVFSRPSDFGMRIIDPPENAMVSLPLLIKGTIARIPPNGWTLWLFTTTPDSAAQWPQSKVSLNGNRWELRLDNMGSFRDKDLWIQLYVVGPVGQTYLMEHRRRGESTGHWPSCPLPEDSIPVSAPLHYVNASTA